MIGEDTIDAVVRRMQQRLDALPPALDHRRIFLQTYLRTIDGAYRRRLAELELLSAAKISDLLVPGQVVLRLAVGGFGVVLPPARQQ